MKLTFTILQIFLVIELLSAQQSKQISAVSGKIFITVPKAVSQTPYLEITNYAFTDVNGNNKIDAGETTTISFDLSNSGKGTGTGLSLMIEEINKINGLEFVKPAQLPDLKYQESKHFDIPVTGSLDLLNGTASFRIIVKEPNGFSSDPLEVEIETQAFRPPLVKLVDYQVSSQTGSTLERRKSFDLEVLIQNLGQGIAGNVSVFVVIPGNIFCLSSNQSFEIGKLLPGEKRLISYTFVANSEYQNNSIEFFFNINEKFGKYAENGVVALTMNQKVSADKLVVKGVVETDVAIAVASLSSDVDKNIPVSVEKRPNKLALIFGNENYAQSVNSEVNVDYARRDAGIFYEYAVKTLGLVEENIYFKTDATSGTMNTEIDRVCELVKRMGSETELIFYYAGHGFPNEQTYAPYLIPVDVNATNLSSAIQLKDVYKKLGATGAKKVTVILDACFSGGGRNQGLLVARSVRIKPKDEELTGNVVVFSASSGEQTASPYHAQKHGIFTYYLLKKLKESNGAVNYGELDSYLRNQVGISSIRVNGKVQDPVTTASPDLSQQWKALTF